MRSLLLVAILVAAIARTAAAGTPVVDPANCTVPDYILLVGASGVVADPLGTFSVTGPFSASADNPPPFQLVPCKFTVMGPFSV